MTISQVCNNVRTTCFGVCVCVSACAVYLTTYKIKYYLNIKRAMHDRAKCNLAVESSFGVVNLSSLLFGK